MRNLIIKSLAIMVLIAMLAGFAGCRSTNSTTSTTTTTWKLIREDRSGTCTMQEKVGIFVDVSLSTEHIQDSLRSEAEKLMEQEKSKGNKVAYWEFSCPENDKDTNLLYALQKAVKCDRIYILTDGWNDPEETWSNLKKDLFCFQDIIFVVPEKTKHTQELQMELENHPEVFPGCSLRIRYMNGGCEIIDWKYEAVEGTVEYYDLFHGATETDAEAETETAGKNSWPWWAWLILLLLLPLLLLLLWWLLKRRRRRKEDEDEEEKPVNEPVARDPIVPPLPEGRVSRIGEVETTPPATLTPPAETVPAPAPAPAQQPETLCNSCCCHYHCCNYCCQRGRSTAAQVVTAIATSLVALLAVAAAAVAIWEHLL